MSTPSRWLTPRLCLRHCHTLGGSEVSPTASLEAGRHGRSPDTDGCDGDSGRSDRPVSAFSGFRPGGALLQPRWNARHAQAAWLLPRSPLPRHRRSRQAGPRHRSRKRRVQRRSGLARCRRGLRPRAATGRQREHDGGTVRADGPASRSRQPPCRTKNAPGSGAHLGALRPGAAPQLHQPHRRGLVHRLAPRPRRPGGLSRTVP